MRAGADRVITPFSTSAIQFAMAATKPHVIDLLDVATGSEEREFEIREVPVPGGSPAVGQSIKDLAINNRLGVIVIGIKPKGQNLHFNPAADTCLRSEDLLITVGSDSNFHQLEQFLGVA